MGGKWKKERNARQPAAEDPGRGERMNPPGSGGLHVPSPVWLTGRHRDTLPDLIFLSCILSQWERRATSRGQEEPRKTVTIGLAHLRQQRESLPHGPGHQSEEEVSS